MRTPLLMTLVFGTAFAVAPARADDTAKLVGDWEGFLQATPARDLQMILHVTKAPDGTLSANLDSPDEGPKVMGLELSKVALEKGEATFTVNLTKAVFTGKLNEAGDAIEGAWKQRAANIPLTFRKRTGPPPPTEVWEGTLKLPNTLELRLIVRVTRPKNGPLRATVESPDQGGIRVSTTTFNQDKMSLKFAVKASGAEYSGTLNEAGDEAKGDFMQGGAKLPLTLKKVAKASEVRRPQEPKKPFPYVEEQVSYENAPAKIKLAGTLTKPKGNGRFPVVLLITGSGAQDRDESLLGHKPFLVLADYLTRNGIAVLRVDDRGVGGSTGDTTQATGADFAEDVLTGVNYLKSRPDIDAKKIGLIGHSEGGLIAPTVAAKSGDVAFIVLMAGTGLPGDEILKLQGQLIFKAAGVDAKTLARQRAMQEKLFAIVRAEKDDKALDARLKEAAKEIVAGLSEEERKAMGGSSIEPQLKMLSTPWFRHFLVYDPRPTLRKVKCPVLALIGEKDLQVPPGENLAEIEKALKEGGNRDATVKELPGLNHLFQMSKTGSPAEYGQIEETINPAALELMSTWVRKRAGLD